MELILPAELIARLTHSVVAVVCAWVSLGEVGRVGCELEGDDTLLDIVLVGQTQVLLAGHVAEHRSATPRNHSTTYGTGYVVIAWGNVSDQRTERVERRFVAKV